MNSLTSGNISGEINKETSAGEEQGNKIFALDIGTRTVVGIIGEEKDDKFCLTDYVVVPHTKRAMVDGQIEDIKQVGKIVAAAKKKLEERNNISLSRVSIAAAGRALKTVCVTMDFDVSDSDIITELMIKSMEIEVIQKAQAELDAENKNSRQVFYCVGHSVVSYRLDDYKIISLEGHKGNTVTIEMIAAFLPSVVVEGLYAVMDMNGLEVSNLTLEPIAAMNVIIPPEIRLINIALVDIGAGTSDIAIAKDGSIVAYAMATTAGDEITEEIIKSYLVDFNMAEDMKQSISAGFEEIEYKDIFGLSHIIDAKEFYDKIFPAVDILAETICANIVKVNGSSPAAVFLIGGGSLINGLPKLIADKLTIDEARVAVGSNEFLKNVNTNGIKMGAEFVTPLGIAVTEKLDQNYDFSVISVNENKIRVFNTKQLSLFELLTMAGYKSTDIMGHSGHNLTFTIDGKRTTVKGGGLVPAEVTVNGKPASLTSKVTQGDSISFKPAVCGENASAKIKDIVDISRFKNGIVNFCGTEHKFGVTFKVNGNDVDAEYEIAPLDDIITEGIITLGDLLTVLDAEISDGFIANGMEIDEDYVLCEGDRIEFVTPEIIHTEPVHVLPKSEDGESITVILNGNSILLKPNPNGAPHTFVELLNFMDIDPDNQQGVIVLKLNNADVKFSDYIKDGDVATIRWEEIKSYL